MLAGAIAFLLSQVEFLDQFLIALRIGVAQIIEQPPPLAYHFEEPAS
jgi:hypothetical protein